jgi:hypothetical protein
VQRTQAKATGADLCSKVASDHMEAFERIIKTYGQIGQNLTRFKVLHETFSDNADFQETLAIFYSDILHFHKEAYKLVRRSGEISMDLCIARYSKG